MLAPPRAAIAAAAADSTSNTATATTRDIFAAMLKILNRGHV